MDAFFASVEQRDFPELKGKPVAVGSSSERGVVAAASYEARKYGVYSAMPSKIAQRKCPNLIFVPARFDVYKAVSSQIREIFLEYTTLVEPLSLDEAYLDVTHNKKGIASAIQVAKDIKQAILWTTHLTASAGVSYNKFLAKTASGLEKPNGLTLIHPEKAAAFIAQLPIEKFHGIGKVTADKMKRMQIFTGADLRKMDLATSIRCFGKAGRHYYHICRGIDERAVNPNRIRKSLSAENTYAQDLFTHAAIWKEVQSILDIAFSRIQRAKVTPKTITLKIKYNDFEIVTRSKTRPTVIQDKKEMLLLLEELLQEFQPPPKGIRLLGVSLSNFVEENLQLTLNFENTD